MNSTFKKLLNYFFPDKGRPIVSGLNHSSTDVTKVEWKKGNAVDVFKETLSKPAINRPLILEKDKVVLEWKMSKSLNYFIWQYFLLFREDNLSKEKPEDRDSKLVELTEIFTELYTKSRLSGHPNDTAVRFFYNTNAMSATLIFVMLGMIFNQHLPKLQHDELKKFLADYYDNLLLVED